MQYKKRKLYESNNSSGKLLYRHNLVDVRIKILLIFLWFYVTLDRFCIESRVSPEHTRSDNERKFVYRKCISGLSTTETTALIHWNTLSPHEKCEENPLKMKKSFILSKPQYFLKTTMWKWSMAFFLNSILPLVVVVFLFCVSFSGTPIKTHRTNRENRVWLGHSCLHLSCA